MEQQLKLSADATQISPTIKKYGPCGSMTGRERQIDNIICDIARIVKICVRHGEVIDHIIVYFQRFDGTEKPYSFGGVGGNLTEIYFKRDEYITCVRGCFGSYKKKEIKHLKSIEITTNYTVYGPYGEDNDQFPQYEFKAVGGHIIGFHGRYGEFIDAIGVYVKEEETIPAEEAHLREQAEKQLTETLESMESSLKLVKEMNEDTVEKLEETRGKLKKVEQSRTYFPVRFFISKEDGKALREAFNMLREMQNLLDEKEKEYQELFNSYHRVLDAPANSYHKMLNENKPLRKLIEDQVSNSFGRVKFTEFTPSEIEAAINDFMNMDYLGQGGYGDVYKTVIGGTTVAIKVPKEFSDQGEREFNQEVEVLSRIQHPNLVNLIGACEERYVLVYEFLSNGSLEDHLKNMKALSWKERIKIAASICSALMFLHNMKPNPIAHGDLKPSNVLFDSNNVCKLSDFGISRVLRYTNDTFTPNHETLEPKGTYSHIDPEFVETHILTPQSDVFAFGIILLQLVTGKGPVGLRNSVLSTLKNKNLETLQTQSQKKILENLIDANLVDPPIDDVVKMTCLGLRCSNPARKNRPDLETEVWSEIKSMNGFAFVR